MKSPFPGMDPYLEAHWGDVHTRIIVYAADQLQSQLPGDLRIHAEEHVTVQYPPDDNGVAPGRSGKYPDLRVVEQAFGHGAAPEAGGVAVADEPEVVALKLEPQTQRSLRIVDTASGNRVVTAIEILSPANKVSERGREAYREKQQELLAGEASLVEIDLLRQGGHVLVAPSRYLRLHHLTPYRICVVRYWRPGQAEVYQRSVRERLPTIRIPLRQSDKDAILNLQELIDKSYQNGAYDGFLDYHGDPQPHLHPNDAAWADALLREKGRR